MLVCRYKVGFENKFRKKLASGYPLGSMTSPATGGWLGLQQQGSIPFQSDIRWLPQDICIAKALSGLYWAVMTRVSRIDTG